MAWLTQLISVSCLVQNVTVTETAFLTNYFVQVYSREFLVKNGQASARSLLQCCIVVSMERHLPQYLIFQATLQVCTLFSQMAEENPEKG